MSNYLDQFPQQQRTFIRNRFSQAYVFSEQSFLYGSEDEIDLAAGPRPMKARVIASCEELLPLVSEEQREALMLCISTIDQSDDLLAEIRQEITTRWEEACEYMKLHPPKERKAEKPTDGQLNFLKSLGCTTEPKSKSEASKLIEEYKGKKKTNYGKQNRMGNVSRYQRARPAQRARSL